MERRMLRMRFSIVITAFIIGSRSINCSYQVENNLYSALLNDDYKVSIRPSLNVNSPLLTEFQIELTGIRSYNLKDQVIVLTAFVMMKWKDVRLQWNESDYNMISRMNFDSSEIWTPDIVLYNTAYTERESWTDTYPSKAIVLQSGEVIWNMPVIWYASCLSDITWFPLDQQNCSLDFGSWSYSYSQLRLVPWQGNSSKGSILPNGEWDIHRTEKTYLNASFTCCPEPFSMMRFTVVLNHLYNFYFIYIIFPVIALCFLFLLTFFIPYEERLAFGITVILSITVYLLVISEKLPEKSDVTPMLGVIFTGEFFILCFGIVINSVSVTIMRSTNVAPSGLWTYCLSMRKENLTERSSMLEMPTKDYKSTSNSNNEQTEDSDGVKERNIEPKVHSFENEWLLIAKKIDLVGFIFTFAMLILLPIIVIASLNKATLQ